ncbi:SDR family NAD(P)-dependent oxidoreductase [Actinomyces ruminis]|uniref:SDR family NAD(P)-dependent oxidoreductase n=1 Tax=Actinomyces ruminis TaxID=1937003 RepID=UPI001C557ABE|nr:SDR family NAD(P)-dependent oxidoreductase [Actinomyces ruminis]
MTTIAIVGGGPGLGRAVARRFGREGFDVALISRSREHLDERVAALSADGVNARGYVADGRDGEALAGPWPTPPASSAPSRCSSGALYRPANS